MFSRSTSHFSTLSSGIFESSANTLEGEDSESGVFKTAEKLKLQSSKNRREELRNRMRYWSERKILPYQVKKFIEFKVIVEACNNPYSCLMTIFSIVEEFTWRHYLLHLQILIKKFTNAIQTTNGTILEQFSNQSTANQNGNCGYMLQQRIQKILHLSDKQLQSHFLILIHGLIINNLKYHILDENRLSVALVHRKSYEKTIREEVLWLLTRISVSSQAILKILKSYQFNQNSSSILPILTILANFIVDKPVDHIEGLIQNALFQQLIQQGVFSLVYEVNRQTVLVCNNIMCKGEKCYQYLKSQTNLIQRITLMENEEVPLFVKLINENG